MFHLSLYAVVLLVHVAAGALLIARSVLASEVRLAIGAARTAAVLRTWVDFGQRSARGKPPLAFAVLLTGIYLGASGWWTQPWFHVSIADWVVMSAIAVAIAQPAAGALADAAARATDDVITPNVDALRRSRAGSIADAAMTGNDLSILYVMFSKPGYVESCLVIAGSMLLAIGWHAFRARRQQDRSEPAAAITSSRAG